MAQSKSSTLFKYFCVATSDAVFQVWEGDASVAGTREHCKAHLRKRFKFGEDVDMTDPTAAAAEKKRVDGLIKRVRRGWWRTHCRFSIGAPRELARRLLQVYYFFRELDDPETGRPFLSSGHEAICRRELGYVAQGLLSDHPTIPLYFELRRASTGLVISRCLRTSSGLEGYHQHLENAVSKCAKAAGLRFTAAMTNEFDWRWVVRAVRKAGLIPLWVRHFNLSLIEYLLDTAIKLLGADEGAHIVSGWRRTRLMESPLVRHGMHYGLAAQRRNGQGSSAAPLRGEGGWVAEQLGESQPVRYRTTAADVDALLGAPADATGEQLSELAHDRGLQLTPAAAEKFVETSLADERARVALEEAGYRELQAQLRVHVPPPQVRDAALPQLGQTVGGDALPGPQPGMQTQELEPAELEPMEEGGGGEEGEGEEGGDEEGEGGGGEDGDYQGGPLKKKGRRQKFNLDGSVFTGSDAEWPAVARAKRNAAQRERRKGPVQRAAEALQNLQDVLNS